MAHTPTNRSAGLEYWLRHFGMPEENIEKCVTQIAQGYGACRYLEGVQIGAEAVNELAEQEHPSFPSNLDEAANHYEEAESWRFEALAHPIRNAFKAGAEWQKEHDHDFCLTCEKNRDVVFHKGMQYAIEQMKKDAIELPVKIDAGGYPYIQITGIEFFDYDKDEPTAKEGDIVKVLIIREDENEN